MSVQFAYGLAVLSDIVLPEWISVFGHKKTPTAPAQVILTLRREEVQKAIDFQMNQKQNSGML